MLCSNSKATAFSRNKLKNNQPFVNRLTQLILFLNSEVLKLTRKISKSQITIKTPFRFQWPAHSRASHTWASWRGSNFFKRLIPSSSLDVIVHTKPTEFWVLTVRGFPSPAPTPTPTPTPTPPPMPQLPPPPLLISRFPQVHYKPNPKCKCKCKCSFTPLSQTFLLQSP